MATNRYKMTGCARFFIFLLFLVPIAYFGAQYLQENGHMDVIKEKFEEIKEDNSNSNDNSSELIAPTESENNSSVSSSELGKLQNKLEQLIRLVDLQKQKIEELESSVTSKDAIIEKLKAQLIANGGVEESTPAQTPAENQKQKNSNTLEELLKEADKALKKNNN